MPDDVWVPGDNSLMPVACPVCGSIGTAKYMPEHLIQEHRKERKMPDEEFDSVDFSKQVIKTHTSRGGEVYSLTITDVGEVTTLGEDYRLFVDDGSERGMSIVVSYEQWQSIVAQMSKYHDKHYATS